MAKNRYGACGVWMAHICTIRSLNAFFNVVDGKMYFYYSIFGRSLLGNTWFSFISFFATYFYVELREYEKSNMINDESTFMFERVANFWQIDFQFFYDVLLDLIGGDNRNLCSIWVHYIVTGMYILEQLKRK